MYLASARELVLIAVRKALKLVFKGLTIAESSKQSFSSYNFDKLARVL